MLHAICNNFVSIWHVQYKSLSIFTLGGYLILYNDCRGQGGGGRTHFPIKFAHTISKNGEIMSLSYFLKFFA